MWATKQTQGFKLFQLMFAYTLFQEKEIKSPKTNQVLNYKS
jgi:hypothetical protein